MSTLNKLEIPEIPAQFIMQLKTAPGRDFIKKEGLIYLGHLQGLKRIDVQVIVFPTVDNPCFCIARAEVETDLGVFSDYGTVSPTNKGAVGGAYPVEMACTRAVNRALRQATNCPLTSYEEMGMEPTEGEPAPRPAARPAPPQQPAAPATPPTPRPLAAPMTDAQRKQIAELQRAVGTTDRVEEMTEERANIHIGQLLKVQANKALAAAVKAEATTEDSAAAPLKWVEQARALATELINEGGTAPAIPNNVTVGKLRAIKKTIDENMALIKANKPPVSPRGAVVGARP